jgi:hypothetical protein
MHARPAPKPRTSLPLGGVALVAALLGSACRDEARVAPAQAPAIDPATRAAMENEIRKELRRELRDELRRELRQEISSELRRELEGRRPVNALPSPDGGADRPEPSRAVPGANAPLVSPTEADEGPGTWIATTDGTVRLLELAVGTGVEDRTPVDVRERYAEIPDMLYCYSAVDSRESDAAITHVWRRDGMLVSRVELEIGKSPRWKTWSKQKTQRHWKGLWSCETLGPDGRHLGVTRFVLGD